jgi:hypothetical protein
MTLHQILDALLSINKIIDNWQEREKERKKERDKDI